jgi:hypothetical protein
MFPQATVLNPNDQIGILPGGQPHPDGLRGVGLPAPNPSLGANMRSRNWSGRESAQYYEMQHAPLPYQFTRDRPHNIWGGGSGSPLTQWDAPQGPPVGFEGRRQPVVYGNPGVAPNMNRPTYAYNRVVGAGRGNPTLYTAPGTWPIQNYPGGGNTYIPSWEATGLIIKYTRDPAYFRINRYVKDLKVPKDQGYYLTMGADEPYRVVAVNDYVWEDSADAPGGRQGRQAFGFQPYRTARYCYPFSLGRKSVQQAEWPVLAEHAATVAAKAMTVRTILNTSLATTNANWAGSGFTNYANVVGQWSNSSIANSYIQQTLNAALIAIEQASGGIVTDEEALQIAMNPYCARNYVAISPEYKGYITGSPDALAAITDQRNPNRKYGLAPFLYGLRLVVENAVRVTTPKGGNVTSPATQTRSYIWPNTQTVISSKPEGLVAAEEQTLDFSTFCMRFYEMMTVESKSDVDNRRDVGRVVEDYTVTLQAPQTGYLINSIS